MPNIGLPELILVLVVALLIFGPKQIPGIGKAIGEGIREFKKTMSGEEKGKKDQMEEKPGEKKE